jgi:protoheme IX farnesyltransferase
MSAYLRLCKLRVAGLLVITALVTAVISAQGRLSVQGLALLALAGGLACIGSAFLNHYFDRDIDGSMSRTQGRPLPSGQIPDPRAVLWVGLTLVALALAFSTLLNPPTTFFILAGAFVYVVVYTLWLKRRSPTSTVVGGLSGSFAALAGWAAVGGQPSPTPFLVALILFLWTPPHFWNFALAHREDYRQAGVPLLPQAHTREYILGSTVLLVLASLGTALAGAPFGWLYLGVAGIVGTLFVMASSRLILDLSQKVAWRAYKLSGAYLLALLLALLVEGLDTVSLHL